MHCNGQAIAWYACGLSMLVVVAIGCGIGSPVAGSRGIPHGPLLGVCSVRASAVLVHVFAHLWPPAPITTVVNPVRKEIIDSLG